MAILCPECGVSQPEGTLFCDKCGANLQTLSTSAQSQPASSPEGFSAGGAGQPYPSPPSVHPLVDDVPASSAVLVCRNCGAQLEPGSRFCDQCGTPVEVENLPSHSPSVSSDPSISSSFSEAISQPQFFSSPAAAASSPPIGKPLPPSSSLSPEQFSPPPQSYAPAVQGRLVVQATNAVLPFPGGKQEFFVGREDPASGHFPDIDLSNHGGDEGGVSRKHARIFWQGTQCYIEDLDSTNYTFVNQERLSPKQPHPLNNGDEVRLGRVKLTFYV